MAKIAPKPNFYILLDIPEHVALSRKQEVEAEEVNRQRNAFLNLIHTLPNGHIVNAANDIDKIVEDAVKIILANTPHQLGQIIETGKGMHQEEDH